jgi:lipoate-protein ligase A
LSAPWEVVRHHEPAASFHARALPDPAARSVWVCQASGPALVLGSAQPDTVVDRGACERAGTEVVRRRSGGGAVLVVPGELLWLDVVLPVGDPLWSADVGVAFHWIGDVWAAALTDLGAADVAVHRGGLVRSRWSSLVCFAGLGPGEVRDATGAKVVGISQRRTRAAARFQCAALARWDPAALVDLLALEPGERAEVRRDIAGVAAGVGVDLDVLLDAFLHHLP